MAMADDINFAMVDLEGDAGRGPSPETLALQATLAEVADWRAKLEALGEPPDHEAVDDARASLASIDAALASDLERLQLSVPPSLQAQKEMEIRDAAQVARLPYQAIIDTDELYRSYEVLLKAAETEMSGAPEAHFPPASSDAKTDEEEGINEEVTQVLIASKQGAIVDVDLKERKLKRLPDAFGSILTILSLDLSNNQLKFLPDSLGGLVELQTLNVEKNNLCSLPDSIGLLQNLKVLNVSRNKLTALPDSISQCRSTIRERRKHGSRADTRQVWCTLARTGWTWDATGMSGNYRVAVAARPSRRYIIFQLKSVATRNIFIPNCNSIVL